MQSGKARPGRAKRVWRRLAAAVLVPLVLLLGLEGALWLWGYGYPTAFFLKASFNGEEARLNNPRYGWRYFGPALARECWPFTFSADKPEGVIRVFVLGESAAMGDPDPRFGLPRMLEAVLTQRFPQKRFEVINTAFAAINSHIIRPIADECVGQQSDLWVVYMGNNEVEGPFGTGTVLGRSMPPLPSIRASLWFKQTRVGQGIDALVRKMEGQPRSPEDWGGMEMLLENKVRRTDPRLESIEARFETNLKSILDAGRRAGAKVVLCTVGVNVRDCAPFASLHTLNLAPAQLASWEHEFQSGLALQNQGDPAGALEHYRRALRIDAEHADLLYRTALCLEAVGDAAESGRYFRSALDADVLRFRADARLNAIVRHSAEGRAEVRLFDAEAALARQSPGGITGGDFFYDHVHLTPSGNYHLARGIASEVATLLELAPEPAGESGWPSESACLRWLGLTERNEVSMLTKVLRRRASPPFSTQLNHAAEVRRLQEMLAGYPQATTASAMSTMARDLAELVSSRPNDADLRSNYASMLQALGRTEEAVREWQEVCRLLPHAVQARIALGLLWERQGGREEAAAQYRECLRLSPLHPQARDRLEQLLPPTVQ